ncbi:MAG: hypothetical protein EXS10_04925 [Phycisphaerales bacterium]|nr:hypothetical protein [Phycisphaerales bacterium]
MKSSFALGSVSLSTVVLGSLLTTTMSLSAQCVVNPSTTYFQNDGGCPVAGVADTNGGCNVVPNAFQATGTINSTPPSSFSIGGSVGYDSVGASRDLDWYTFTVDSPCFINISVNALRPDGTPSAAFLVFFGNPTLCDSFFGYQYAACPMVFPEQGVAAGTYAVIVTTAFVATEPCETAYSIDVSGRFSQFIACGDPAAGDCGLAHPATVGCSDLICCDIVCTVNPLCCDIGWDQACSSAAQVPPASGGCGVFVYNCTIGVPANAPSNNCATNATIVAMEATSTFDNSNATTDGPNNGQCGAETYLDVWVMGQAPDAGNMFCYVNSGSQDVVLSVYNNGTSTTVVGTELSNNYLGCVDVYGIGGEAAVLPNTIGGNWYVWRVGIWGNPGTPGGAGVPGAGDITLGFERVVYDTGTHGTVCTPAGVATNLGLSSGAIAVTAPQRWIASPFTVTDPDGTGPSNSWELTLMQPEGFAPAGVINEKLNWIIWNRVNSDKPLYATNQLASGQVTYPVLGAAGQADVPTTLTLTAGSYYATFFASAVGNPCRASDGQAILSNFAWFTGAPAGDISTDATGQFLWRSATQAGSGPAIQTVVAGTATPCTNPTGVGFARYTLGTAYVACAGGDPASVLRVALHIMGNPVMAVNPCPTDLDANGVTDAADLAMLLNAWGTGGVDLNGDGLTDAADLAALLNGWGACP